MILFLISLCGLASSVAYRSMDPLVTSLARDFSVPVATAALVSSAYALPFALGQPVLGPIGDVFGKGKLLAICLAADASVRSGHPVNLQESPWAR